MNKKKIFNDPIYGFITIHSELIYDIISHPFFQRLRRIKQLGLTDFVYPGALHTRFHHALGAMYLMKITLDNLRLKGVEIDDNEYESSCIAVLLHDIGHGPFSHALEHSLLKNIRHERLSQLLMAELNTKFNGELAMAISIFNGTYHRPFFHQLVSSQLDVDRLDYLQRDSYFTGVHEGTIGADRIIKMLNVVNEHIVVEQKGIYSIENFLSARRLMYWQVYLHKVTVSSEKMVIQLINRAKFLYKTGEKVFCTPALSPFLDRDVSIDDFENHHSYLESFGKIDDNDIWACIKMWTEERDAILSTLSEMLITRKLFRVILSNDEFDIGILQGLSERVKSQYHVNNDELSYLFVKGSMSNSAYVQGDSINILTKSGDIIDVAQASDLPNIKAMSKIVKKYYLCWPKDVTL